MKYLIIAVTLFLIQVNAAKADDACMQICLGSNSYGYCSQVCNASQPIFDVACYGQCLANGAAAWQCQKACTR